MSLPTRTLASLRAYARMLANAEHSEFVTDAEVTLYVNSGIRGLYDKLCMVHGQEYFIKAAVIPLNESLIYDLPDDLLSLKRVDHSAQTPSFVRAVYVSGGPFPAPETNVVTTWDVPYLPYEHQRLVPFMFGGDQACPPDGAPPLMYRVFASGLTEGTVISPGEGAEPALQREYRNMIRLNDTTSGNLVVWYVPEAPVLVNDTDEFPFFHGMEEMVAILAAIMIRGKEGESPAHLNAALARVERRIEAAGFKRDIGNPERVSRL